MYKVQKFLPSIPIERHGSLKAVFNDEEIERIQFFEKILKFSEANVGNGQDQRNDPAIRQCETAFMHVDQNTEWLWQKIASFVGKANYELFLYDIQFIQSIQYTIYNSSDEDNGDFYTWHRDDSLTGYAETDRVISGSILLSDPDDFEGGDFEIDIAGNMNPQKLVLEKGDIFFFDSSMSHRVTPVTSGQRKTLVFWVCGKKQIA